LLLDTVSAINATDQLPDQL